MIWFRFWFWFWSIYFRLWVTIAKSLGIKLHEKDKPVISAVLHILTFGSAVGKLFIFTTNTLKVYDDDAYADANATANANVNADAVADADADANS